MVPALQKTDLNPERLGLEEKEVAINGRALVMTACHGSCILGMESKIWTDQKAHERSGTWKVVKCWHACWHC